MATNCFNNSSKAGQLINGILLYFIYGILDVREQFKIQIVKLNHIWKMIFHSYVVYLWKRQGVLTFCSPLHLGSLFLSTAFITEIQPLSRKSVNCTLSYTFFSPTLADLLCWRCCCYNARLPLLWTSNFTQHSLAVEQVEPHQTLSDGVLDCSADFIKVVFIFIRLQKRKEGDSVTHCGLNM